MTSSSTFDRGFAHAVPGAHDTSDASQDVSKTTADTVKADRRYICSVHETMATVAAYVFEASPGISEHPAQQQEFVDELERIRERGKSGCPMGKVRPCVVFSDPSAPLDGDRTQSQAPLICIMGTFGGAPPRGRMFEHFSIPVSSNRGLLRRGDTPNHRDSPECLHTSPRPWGRPGQWLVAFPYHTPTAIIGRWQFSGYANQYAGGQSATSHLGDDNPNSTYQGYWLDADADLWLREQCALRLAEWSELCKADPNYARSCALEYRHCRANASRQSVASCSSAASWRSNRSGPRTRPGTPLRQVLDPGQYSVTAPPSPRRGGVISPRCESPARGVTNGCYKIPHRRLPNTVNLMDAKMSTLLLQRSSSEVEARA
ncbi:hypothetical protein C2E23DRAFT_576131 [Lenzites betulinus]|nr:hypothetical protein C2E23DRAFT_576131 [Lenzites betulinus]